MSELLKVKLIEDLEKYNHSRHLGNIFNEKLNFSTEYVNILKLIRNTIHNNNIKNNVDQELSILDLNNINIDFISEISKSHNINIVDCPVFLAGKLVDNKYNIFQLSVQPYENINTLDIIKSHKYHTFYIYIIDEFSTRWNMYADEKCVKRQERKEKIKKLNLI